MSTATEEPAEKKKKRRKREPEAPAPLPGEGTPEGALLREANAAFAAGNYVRVREIVAQLRSTAGSGDPKVVDAANDLAHRIAVDPLQIGFLVACLVAISIIFYVYVIR